MSDFIQVFVRTDDLIPNEPAILPLPDRFNDPDEEILKDNDMDAIKTWGEDIRENGIKYSLAIDKFGNIRDGNSRYWIAKHLGIEYVPVNFEFMAGTDKKLYPKKEAR